MNRYIAIILSLALVTAINTATAGNIKKHKLTVEITNVSNAIYFTPLLVAAHKRNTHLFQLGTAASMNLQAMAEGGDISGLVADVQAIGGNHVANPAMGLLGPGATTSAELKVDRIRNRHLSIVAMLLPTNDGFVGLDAARIPQRRGTYTYYLSGYDAGTEANDELITGGGAPGVPGIPADPGGNAGTGGTGVSGNDHNATVHIHRGNVGDLDPAGGASDLNSGVHRWLNPVAIVKLRVH